MIKASDSWEVISGLIALGYRGARIRLNVDAGSRFDGICQLSRGTIPAAVNLDVHIGGFPACGGEPLKVEDSDVGMSGLGYRTPSLAASRRILLGHVVRQGFVRLRDINDFYLLLKATSLEPPEMEPWLESVSVAMGRLGRWVYGDFWPQPSGQPGLLDRKLLMEPRRIRPGVADGHSFKWSHYWQARYIYETARPSVGSRGAVKTAANALPHLLRTNRPFPVWKNRVIADPVSSDRLVLRPILLLRQPVDLEAMMGEGDVSDKASFLGGQVITLTDGSLVFALGNMILVQSDYPGSWPSPYELIESAHALCEILGLKDAGAEIVV